MTAAIQGKSNGTQGALLVNGTEVVTFDSTGIVAGVNKSAVSQMPVLATAQNTTSGTAIDFTGIPSWVKRITVMLNGVSTSGTADVLFQIGTSGGIQVTGYLGASTITTNSTASSNLSSGFLDFNNGTSAADVRHGSIVFTLMDAPTGTWVATGFIGYSSSGRTHNIFGSKTLSGTLDRVRMTTTGADTFDAGSVNILYE